MSAAHEDMIVLVDRRQRRIVRLHGWAACRLSLVVNDCCERVGFGEKTPAFAWCMRIVLVGPLCSGKSTLALRLSAELGLPCIEMDDLIWRPNWQRLDKDDLQQFRVLCSKATADRAWVCAGAWQAGKDIVFSRADTIVSIDLGLWHVFYRMVLRTLWRIWSGEAVCNGNRETLLSTLFGRQSILRYFWKQWPRRRNHAEKLRHLEGLQMQAPRAQLLYFSTSGQVEAWVAQITSTRPGSA